MYNLKLSNKIKFLICDFDGVFTDGSIFLGENGASFKKLSYKDIMGISNVIKAGFKIAFVSGDKTPAIDVIAKKFNIEDNYQDIRNKKEIVEKLLEKYSLAPNEALYIGDDINDIESMKLVDYRIAPENANYKVKQVENIQITTATGGDGAFREVADSLLELIK